MNTTVNIRKASFSDAIAIASIYNYYVENTIVTFEENLVSIGEMERRIKQISLNYPFLVIEKGNVALGYAYATPWKDRSAYRFSAEVSVYLHPNEIGKGYGQLIFKELLNQLKETKAHALVGGIALPNDASIALHEKFGFKKIAQFEQVGFKFGQWIDVAYWELILRNCLKIRIKSV